MRDVNRALAPMGDAHPLVRRLAQARELLAEARSIDWVKTLHDQAEAVRVYARQHQLGREAEVYAAEIKVRAAKRLGDLSRELPTAQGTRTDQGTCADRRHKLDVLRDAGVSHQRASEYERLAALREETFEAKLREAAEHGRPVTTAGLLRAVPSEPAPVAEATIRPPEAPLAGECPYCGHAVLIQVQCDPLRRHRIFWVPIARLGQDWFPEEDAAGWQAERGRAP